ncbi:MAG: DUF3616 domain-containing protein [Sedimentisphaerales bacterium]|nr:DUF3616 domain-containing protein [Sedimentisphaerales bacterium]
MLYKIIMTGFLLIGIWQNAFAQGSDIILYRGTSDASTAIAIDTDRFLVADDENNVLRVYSLNHPGLPLSSLDLSSYLRAGGEHIEADIEGSARIGDRVYWITSHGRNKDGKLRPNRYRFFATDLRIEDDYVHILPVGRPCPTLAHRMAQDLDLTYLRLDKVTRFDERNMSKKEREQLAPKEEGLNIEGLAATPDGKGLLIGLRNPTYPSPSSGQRQAIVIPLLNPDEVIEKADRPRFGKPLHWNLGGLGIRSMEYCPSFKAYFLVAGPKDGGPGMVLCRWSGKPSEQPESIHQFDKTSDFTPEALFAISVTGEIGLLSDDGTLPIKVNHPSECMENELLNDTECPNKYLVDPNRKTFRAIRMTPEQN